MHTFAISPVPSVSQISAVRWAAGAIAAVLWPALVFSGSENRLWLVVAALTCVQVFGTGCAAILLLRKELVPLIVVVTDWGGMVASIMIWVIGIGAAALFGVESKHVLVLAGCGVLAFFWMVMLYFSSTHRDVRGRE